MTRAQSILLIVAFLLKNNLTDAALTDLLDILSLFLPSTFPPSKYKFYKAIHVDDSKVRKVFLFLYNVLLDLQYVRMVMG